MNKFELAKISISKVAGRSGLVVRKLSPEILIATGIVGVVASTVLACRATLKVETLIDESQEKIGKIKTARETFEEDKYSDADYKKDMSIVYVQRGVDLLKLYGPAVTLGVASIACILGAHNVMKKRNVALMAAYKAIEQSFAGYRDRVIEEFGEDKDRQYRYGVHEEQVTVIEEDAEGKKKKVKKTIEVVDPNQHSPYARFFDESSANWSKNAEHNMMFVRCQQNWANDLLHSRGHVFLNEVYDMLGLPRSQSGAVVGWVMSDGGDGFIDFGMYDVDNERGRDFVNGYERNILLDFNVDGVIYDLI